MFIFLHRFLLQRTTIATRVCVCVYCRSIYSGRQACGRTSRGHTGGRSHRILHLPSAVLALIFIARRIYLVVLFPRRPSSYFFSTNEVIVLHLLGTIFSRVIVGNFPDVKLPPWWAEALPPYFGFTAFRQSRYRQKPKNRLLPKNYRYTLVLPPSAEVVTAKKRKTTTTNKLPPYGITAQKVPPAILPLCLNGQKRWICASLSRYPITRVQTHAGTLIFLDEKKKLFFVLLVL